MDEIGRAFRERVGVFEGAAGLVGAADNAAFLVLATFALTGQLVFRFFSITVDSLRIVGGVLFFSMGSEMLQARLTRTQHGSEEVSEYVNDIAITPLGIPMICGPGAITTVILLMNGSPDMTHRAALFMVMAAVMLITAALLLGVTLGSVDGDPGVLVEMHIFVGSKAPWDHIGGHAPQHEAFPPDAPTNEH